MHVCILSVFGLCIHFLIWFALLALLVVALFVTRTIDDGAVFNVIVLIGSLISTVVVAFTIIMRTLEEYCRISTSEPNKHVIGDQASTTASAESALTAAAEKASGAAGNKSTGMVGVRSFSEASSGYADFVSGGGRDADDTDDGRVLGALPFHGNVMFQASAGSECAIEMQSVQKLPLSISAAPAAVIVSALHDQRHQQHERSIGVDRDSQMMEMLSRLAERSESQHAALIAQVARSEMQIRALVGELAALRYDHERKFELQDQKINDALISTPAQVDA